MEIIIKDRVCFICGGEVTRDRIRAHLIPRTLKPKINILTYFHKECEQRLNSLYVSQQKKPRAKKKLLNILKDLKIKIKAIEARIEEEEKEEKKEI